MRARVFVSAAAAVGVAGYLAIVVGRRQCLRQLKKLLDVTPPPPDAPLLSSLDAIVFDCDGGES